MKTRPSLFAIAALAALSGCIAPYKNSKSPGVERATVAPEEQSPETERVATSPPEPRQVDERATVAPTVLRLPTTTAVLEFDPGAPPAPLVVPLPDPVGLAEREPLQRSETLANELTKSDFDSAAIHSASASGALADRFAESLERALLARGVKLLERKTIESLAFEHWLGRGEASHLPQGVAMLGVMPLPLLVIDDKHRQTVSLFSGPRGQADRWQLEPASWVVFLERCALSTRALRLPFAERLLTQIPYVPVEVPFEQVAPKRSIRWLPDRDDPFRRSVESPRAFLDPQSGGLWTIRQAWVGHQVSRSDWIAARTQVSEQHCDICGAIEKSEVRGPDDPPTHWRCKACGNRYEMPYFDGYRLPDRAPDGLSEEYAIVRVEPLAQADGLIEVLSPSELAPTPGTLRGDLLVVPLNADLDPLIELDSEEVEWALAGDRAVLTFPGELQGELERHLARGSRPSVGADGRQVYQLDPDAGPRYADRETTLEVSELHVELRIVHAPTGQVGYIGEGQVSFLDLDRTPRRFPYLESGVPDFSLLAGAEVQADRLARESLPLITVDLLERLR